MKLSALFLQISLMGFLLGSHARAQAVKVDFEPAEGYVTGTGLIGQGWSVEEGSQALIDSEDSAHGAQSLKVQVGTPVGAVHYVNLAVTANTVRFVDMWLKPVAKEPSEAEANFNAWGSSFGFVKTGNGTIQIALVDGENQTGQTVATDLQSGESGEANKWVRISLRQDPLNATWDVYVDGKLSATDLTMDGEGRGEFALYGSDNVATSLDSLSVDKENPLFADADGDGMPDAEEVANGLNPHLNDRNGDIDGDGVSNIQEMAAGTSPSLAGIAGANGTIGVLYVDNLSGNDVNSGKHSYTQGGDGPKASIKATMAAAGDGDMVVVMPGTGIYNEGSRGVRGKRLTIKSLKDVTIN